IGKPIANTYKAIESLARKGAIVIDETGSRLCRAVSPVEVLEHAELAFRERHDAASRALSMLPIAGQDPGVYALTSRDQVFDRVRRMMSSARDVALLDLFPEPFEELASAMREARDRGISIGVQVYRPAEMTGVEIVLKTSAA